jgi:hypothetical protein
VTRTRYPIPCTPNRTPRNPEPVQRTPPTQYPLTSPREFERNLYGFGSKSV